MNNTARREKIISNYIEAYNQFNVSKMVRDFDDNLKFENIENGHTTLILNGLDSFREQASQAVSFFSSRIQTVKTYLHREEETEVEIGYFAVLAIDLPNGLKRGDEIKLQGKSIFKFSGNKVVELSDISQI